jgi:predicted PurR-regulated permease PerM
MDLEKAKKEYFLLAIIIILIILSYFVIKPFLMPLISAFILAYLILPIYKNLEKKTNKNISALLSVLLITLVIIIPLTIIGNAIFTSAQSITPEKINLISKYVESNKYLAYSNINIESIIILAKNFLTTSLKSSITIFSTWILNLIIILLAVFYILLNWTEISIKLKKIIPFKDKEKKSNQISLITNKIIYATTIVAIIEFVMALVGFYLSNVTSPLLFASIVFIMAYIPGVGPVFVWLPLAIYYLATSQYSILLGVVITGIIISVLGDTILRFKIIGKSAEINPLIMLISILGGISVFGIFGFIIGPILIVSTIELLESLFEN